jgi:hypothetical protein
MVSGIRLNHPRKVSAGGFLSLTETGIIPIITAESMKKGGGGYADISVSILYERSAG